MVVQDGQMGRTRENTGCLAAATKWATRAQTNLPNKRAPRGGNATGTNQETTDQVEEQRRQCEAHKARQVEIDATEARRLEQVQAAKAQGKPAGMNQETIDHFDEQRRQCEAHKARQVEIDATEARRLEQVRAAKADGKLYDWQAWDAHKAVHATVPVAVGRQILLGIQP